MSADSILPDNRSGDKPPQEQYVIKMAQRSFESAAIPLGVIAADLLQHSNAPELERLSSELLQAIAMLNLELKRTAEAQRRDGEVSHE